MIRVVIYGFLGMPVGAFVGLVISLGFSLAPDALFGTIFGAITCSLGGVLLARFMNTNHIMERPFWNRQDVEALIAVRPAISGFGERLHAWMRSKVRD